MSDSPLSDVPTDLDGYNPHDEPALPGLFTPFQQSNPIPVRLHPPSQMLPPTQSLLFTKELYSRILLESNPPTIKKTEQSSFKFGLLPSSPHHHQFGRSNRNLDDDEDTANSPASALIFYEMDDVAHALDDWAVKEKFVFRTECRDAELPGFVRRKAAPSEVTVARSRQQHFLRQAGSPPPHRWRHLAVANPHHFRPHCGPQLAASPQKAPPDKGPPMASLVELSVPIDGTEFADIDTLIHALDDWAVKHKFCFRLFRRDKKRI
ncbi:hypothetical protein VC83_05422 [Pseudogymnoascus destructans]|uniref:Uncharacterized protein n=1 Tax=Pseudogymnoascus destructans TaxID=655981 RepID=A0A177A7C1_9PEZI|nr:uncharacterized protein VC83_05422 [Pseudogymnoascus destructans]OAF58058.1 hypothetical protein VC83_05422 [Pseudogymnoascus destructans]